LIDYKGDFGEIDLKEVRTYSIKNIGNVFSGEYNESKPSLLKTQSSTSLDLIILNYHGNIELILRLTSSDTEYVVFIVEGTSQRRNIKIFLR